MLVIVASIVTFLVLTVDTKAKLSYLGKKLDCNANWNDLEICFKGYFQEGMSQQEVYDTLLRLDPKLTGRLGTDLDCTAVGCCELVVLFQDRLGRSFGYIFCFDNDKKLLFLSLAS